MLTWPTLSHYERNDRLLTAKNSNGFMPGEGAGALLLEAPAGRDELLCTGLGFGIEKAHIDSGEPLRADGLSPRFKAALADAAREMHDFDFRITDMSGEQYYFKEASLALAARCASARRSSTSGIRPNAPARRVRLPASR